MTSLKKLASIGFLFLFNAAFAASPTPTPTVSPEEEMQQKIFDDPLFKPSVDDCRKNSQDDFAGCVRKKWEDLQRANSETTKKIMNNVMPADNKNKSTIGYESVETIGVGLDGLDQKSPHQKAIEEYLEKQLNEALYGKDGPLKKGSTLTDHSIFYDLYKSALGKSVIASFSAFCYEACELKPDENSVPYLAEDSNKRKICKDQNMKDLAANTTNTTNAWTHCIKTISNLCLTELKPTQDTDYTKKQACLITERVKALRQDMISTDKIKEDFKNLGNSKTTNFNKIDKVDLYDPTKKKSIDDLTSMASGNLDKALEENSASTNIASEKKKVDDCKKILDANGKSADPACEGIFLDADKGKELQDTLAKEQAAALAVDEKIRTVETKEDLTKLLADVGRTNTASIEAKIQEKTSTGSTEKEAIESIRTDIAKQYKTEKDEVIKALADKLKDKTISASSASDNRTYIDKISEELNSKTNDLTSFLHFNNIVSGFLNVSGGDGKDQATNYQSIKRELESSVFLDEKKAKEANNYQFKSLQDNIGKTSQGNSSDTKGTVNLEVNTINNELIKDY